MSLHIEFDNNIISQLLGDNDCNLKHIEEKLDVEIACRGGNIYIEGKNNKIALKILKDAYQLLKKTNNIDLKDIKGLVRMAGSGDQTEDIVIKTPKKYVKAQSVNQKKYMNSILNKDIIFGLGPAGTGKTYLAVAAAINMFDENNIDRIILSRPAIEAGEKIGFLPGDMKDKVDPYLRPLYDALHDMVEPDRLQKFLENGEIEIAPIAFMRGRTLNAFVILDEAQNCTKEQMKMFLTRMGERSKMVITGDLSQIDLPKGQDSGLADAIERLKDINEIDFIKFDAKDIVRHPLVEKIVKAYDK